MRVYVNDQPLELIVGMRVEHALLKAGLLAVVQGGKKVYDQWGHEVGLSGALAPDLKLYVR